MPHTNAGNKYSAPYDHRAPNIDSTPPKTQAREVRFVPSTLSGPGRVKVGGVEYNIPAHSLVKYRKALVWLLVGDRVHVLSQHGEVVLSEHEQQRFAKGWRSI